MVFVAGLRLVRTLAVDPQEAVERHRRAGGGRARGEQRRAAHRQQRLRVPEQSGSEPPRVSVVIPTHNRAEWLPRAVASVLAQTWTDFELLIVDDHSTDETPALIARFADRRIRSFRHERNMGQSKALNTGIEHARGEYVAFLDDDDEWLPGKLAAQVALLDAAPPEVGLVYCWRDELEEASRRRKVWECVANLLDIRRDEPDEASRRRIGTTRLTLRGDIFEHVLARLIRRSS